MIGLRPDEAPTSPGFNFREFLELVGDDREFLDDFTALFDQDASRLVVEVREAAVGLDGPALRRAAHALKGLLSHFGESKAFELCRDLEASGQSSDLEGSEEKANRLASEVDQICRALADLGR